MLTQMWQMRRQCSEEMTLLSMTDLYRDEFPLALTSAGPFTELDLTLPAQDPVTGYFSQLFKTWAFLA